MSVLRGIVVLCVLTISVCGFAATLTQWRMVDEVNKKLPPEERLYAIGGPWRKRNHARSKYRRLYPNGPLLRRERLLTAIEGAAVVLLTALMGLTLWVTLWMLFGFSIVWWLSYGADVRHSRTQ
jgi:hypothetical protein